MATKKRNKKGPKGPAQPRFTAPVRVETVATVEREPEIALHIGLRPGPVSESFLRRTRALGLAGVATGESYRRWFNDEGRHPAVEDELVYHRVLCDDRTDVSRVREALRLIRLTARVSDTSGDGYLTEANDYDRPVKELATVREEF